MKSLKYISALALSVALMSCSYDLPNPPGQTNEQPEFFFQNDDLAIEKEGQTYNLQQLNENAQDLVVAKVTKLVNFPADYTLSADVVVSNDASFSKTSTITATVANNEISVLPTLMNSAIEEVITKAPGTYTTYIKVIAYAERGATRIRLGGLTNSYVNLPYQITTFDAAKVIEQNYYFYNASDKSIHKMDNVLGPNVNAYDSPEFIYVFDAPAGGMDWYIVPESAYNNGNPDLSNSIGCIPSQDSDLSGKLVAGGNAGTLTKDGPVRIVINMETDAYDFMKALDFLYVLSGASVSTPSKGMLLPSADYINYKGVGTISDGYYLTGQPSYKAESDIVFYQDTKGSFLDNWDGDESTITRSGYMTFTPGTQLKAPFKDETLYYIEANTIWMTYNITALQSIQIEVNGKLYDMTPEVGNRGKLNVKVWNSDGKVDLSTGFKFWCNGHEVATFGAVAGQTLSGETGTLECEVSYQGEIIRQQGNHDLGSCNVQLDFSQLPYTVTLTK